MREGGSGSEGREGGLRKGTSEEGTELGMDGVRERGKGGSKYKTTHTAALAIETLVLRMKNSEQV